MRVPHVSADPEQRQPPGGANEQVESVRVAVEPPRVTESLVVGVTAPDEADDVSVALQRHDDRDGRQRQQEGHAETGRAAQRG